MSENENKSDSRRRFLLQTSAAAVVASAGVAAEGCGTGGTGMMMGSAKPTGLTVADVAVGQLKPATTSNVKAIIGRDAMGFYALSRTCTHSACTVEPPDAMNSIACTCHSSRFDALGAVTQMAMGASRQDPLPHLRVSFTGTGATAQILVDDSVMGELTGNTQRFPAPT